MITRLWRGWTAHAQADEYERFLAEDLFPRMRELPGFLGADLLRRASDDEVAFVALTRFRSLDDVRAFAGEDLDVAVIEPRAAELLARCDERATHYETFSFVV